MSDVTRYFFLRNRMEDKTWVAPFQLQDHEAPPGKCVRIRGKGDDQAIQFKEDDAKLLLSIMPPEIAEHFELSLTSADIPKDNLTPAPAPKVEHADIPNAPDRDYPDGEPSMGWNRPQALAWLRDYDDKLLKKITKQPKLSVEGIILSIWEIMDKAKYDRYMAKRKG